MTIIRQQSLFSIEELYEPEPTQKYEEIMDAIDLDAIFYEINKKSRFGAPTELNYGAMIVSVSHVILNAFQQSKTSSSD